MDQVLAILDSAIGHSAVIAVVVEFILRMIPTAKPMGVLHLVATFVHGAAMVLAKFAELLDKVLPQNVK